MPTATRHRQRLGDLLIARGVITDDQLALALAAQQQGQQQRLVGEILVGLGYASKEQILSAVAESCGIPFARLMAPLVDPAVRGALPETFIRKHGVLPLFKVRDVLTVAVSEPSNVFLADEVAHASGLSVQVVAAAADNIYQMIEQGPSPSAQGPSPQEVAAGEVLPGADLALAEDFDGAHGNQSPEKIAGLLIREAVRARASAIHLEPDEKVLRVRFCVDGVLHVVMRPPARLAAGLTGAFEEMLGFAGRAASAQDSRRSVRLLVQGRAVQLHLASLGGAFGLRVVIRLVRDEDAQKPLEKLGFDFALLDRYRQLIAPLRGLVLVAGPRGSGATTTLYSTLNALDPIRYNLCTLETCINFNLAGINQFSAATCGTTDTGSALARLLLQQPDVLALDCEMNEAVVGLAVEAAREGRLVLAHLRAADAADAVARLAARAPADALGPALRGVLAQRLVRTVCPHCRSSHDPPAALRRRISETFGPIEDYVKGRGCAACGRTGLVGRIGLFELVPLEGGLVDLLKTRADGDAWRAAIRAAGHPSLWVDGINKVRAGITSLDEVMTVLAGCPGEPGPSTAIGRAGCPDAPAGPPRPH
jgi:type IV pilus assembly protein PilB